MKVVKNPILLASAATLVALTFLCGIPPDGGVDQQLKTQYQPASVTDAGKVVRPGTFLTVAIDGIKSVPPSAHVYWYNSHKPGGPIKYSSVFETLSKNLADQVQVLQVGEKVVLAKLDVKLKSSEVDFFVQTAGREPTRAVVLFQFQKGFFIPENLKAILDSINEVFTIESSGDQAAVVSSLDAGQGAANSRVDPSSSISGSYYMPETGSHLQLNVDGGFSMKASDGTERPGRFSTANGMLTLTYSATGLSSVYKIQGDKMYASTGKAWIRQGVPPTPSPLPQASLNLPAVFVSTQSPSDQLRLNADHSFQLSEGGQSFHGRFTLNGSALELDIAESNAKSPATVQGDSLTDSSGQKWTMQTPSPDMANSEPVLRDDDIIKMIKIGLSDDIIISKIKSSKCQFDTSTDALIRLKQNGTSAQVLSEIMANHN